MTSDSFLRLFIDEARRLAPSTTCSSLQSFIRQVVFDSSASLEARFRGTSHVQGRLTPPQYADLIVDLKNSIGGTFSVVSADSDCVSVRTGRCPFGDLAQTAPGLCHMTSSIFGGIAARNFGYAKVELGERIALGADHCNIHIHLSPKSGEEVIGDEYFSDGNHVIADVLAADNLQQTIEERLHDLWARNSAAQAGNNITERPRLVAESPQMRSLLRAVDKVADTRATVLLQGETGVGKEIVAKSIHSMSPRIAHPFVAMNCGSLPAELIESELFGHEAGAFTDAKQRREGRFETADKGTLFLDEVDSLSPKAQVSLLRVLQEGKFERVGGRNPVACDVRVIAASNRDLKGMVARGEFRNDLFFRLNVVPLRIPPLRERRDDILPLARIILERMAERHGDGPGEIPPHVIRRLEAYDWPGNVRELENVLERAFLFSEGKSLHIQSLSDPEGTGQGTASGSRIDLKALRKDAADGVEKRILEQVLAENGGNVQTAADILGLSPRAVYLKLAHHGLKPDRR